MSVLKISTERIVYLAHMSELELQQERAKDWHDGQVDPDWRGRGASIALDLNRVAKLACKDKSE